MPIYRNWEDEKKYEFTKTLDLHGWAWEFLRRNEDYISAWSELFKKHIQDGGMSVETAIPLDTQNPHMKALQEFWRVSHFIDPSCDSSYPMVFDEENPMLAIRFSEKFEKRLFIDYAFEYKKIEVPYGFAAVIFNLNKPLEAQAEVAIKELSSYKKMHFMDDPPIKPHKEKWVEYLRILDAKNDDLNIKNSKIAQVLYSKDDPKSANKKVSDSYKKAKMLVKGEFRKYLNKSIIGEI